MDGMVGMKLRTKVLEEFFLGEIASEELNRPFVKNFKIWEYFKWLCVGGKYYVP